MHSSLLQKLLIFLEQDMRLESQEIALALRNVQIPSQLPVSLWQYGLISLDDLNHIWNWIESVAASDCTSTRLCS